MIENKFNQIMNQSLTLLKVQKICNCPLLSQLESTKKPIADLYLHRQMTGYG